MIQREEIIAGIASVPPLPSASTEVIRLLRDPEAPSNKVAQAIEYDPSLTMNILRLANSTSFGFPQSVSTVKEAFVRLGPKKGFQSVFDATISKIAEIPCNGYLWADGGPAVSTNRSWERTAWTRGELGLQLRDAQRYSSALVVELGQTSFPTGDLVLQVLASSLLSSHTTFLHGLVHKDLFDCSRQPRSSAKTASRKAGSGA
jgi:hypothetical protein